MVGMDGHLKLTDFGMSKRFDSKQGMTTGTLTYDHRHHLTLTLTLTLTLARHDHGHHLRHA